MITAMTTTPMLPPTIYGVCTPPSVPVFSMAWINQDKEGCVTYANVNHTMYNVQCMN